MRTRTIISFTALLLLGGCGSLTLPAAVKMNGGEVLTGTTTASLAGGTFQVKSPTGTLSCSGNYDAFDTNPVISAPVTCSDGRYGTITMTRDIANHSGRGIVQLSSGEMGTAAFGKAAGSVLVATPSAANLGGPYAAAGLYNASPNVGGAYSGNCPTPESIAADGKRCGKRSAASKIGGYEPHRYSSYGGTTYVRGHFRKGRYVRGHTRRR